VLERREVGGKRLAATTTPVSCECFCVPLLPLATRRQSGVVQVVTANESAKGPRDDPAVAKLAALPPVSTMNEVSIQCMGGWDPTPTCISWKHYKLVTNERIHFSCGCVAGVADRPGRSADQAA
jgi:hypothetical protein